MSNDPPTVPSQALIRILETLRFNGDGLIPAIAQQHDTGEILMMAWMNRDSIAETLKSGQVCYWSRSRGKLWRKGESSGQEQRLKDFRWDCDADTLLLLVDQKGVACHTGRKNCFFNAIRDGEVAVISDVETDPKELYGSKK
ncbi:MAG: phosphoribosyl-AMP cyclohydrolase [Rhodospirillales bacterium]|nr:phosphoribosyl-AMP cyclohydrolase [Rhodospirillales bacterium]